ncbi:MAG: signal peptidase II [Candidatus Coatesbacteria bacterium]|nr:MAG: signal peptidase II [Candidatus Coatesbacteria bacterium]
MKLKRHLRFSVLMLAILVADQVTKYLVVRYVRFGDRVPVIDGIINLVYSRNTGGAFSLFPDKPVLFLVLSIAALALLGYLYFKLEGKLWAKLSAVAIMGGALGNLVDRLHYGQVVDFIDVHFGTWHWYVFNVADAAISIGAAGLFITTAVSEIREWRKRKRECPDGARVSTAGEPGSNGNEPPVQSDEGK